ncbi:unnamed protein product [Tilletia controversa]|uniref:Protein HIR n=3 Tax=Tilletia TaxID=13289 RepID=A0A8X7SV86_9BASI|nr:hypothetical protein CF328_g4995 [Tilletia controversa]KAE8196267.1 hypothetical protein CF336_g2701 [Tilletia laevis]KAE8257057.1 hypothetical protein A4X03_0g4799 [Tilletia caries]KAE8198408.1 hypothetical protein CF335_g4390 [Tilletia laevis]KAE8245175.1 hypothetical protein A4X06_0g5796 [Tilletia controversa]
MSVILPDWVAHVDSEKKKRQTIFSVHAHPDGTRIATGGLDSKVCIWATAPLLDEAQDNDKTDKLLSTLSRHSGSVLVVRWSHSGGFLASGSDDTVALIWELDPTGSGSMAFGSTEMDIETYRCVRRLTGHESDVADLAWSPHDEYLATVGLDSMVWIYSGFSFDRLHKIDGHQGFVKGVVWDSVGHFLATASDDKTVKVWRAPGWSLEAEVKAPFTTSPNAPFFRRPSWSPDGAHLLTANAMNGPVFVASVIMRGPWTSDVSLVGHENAVSVTAFNPRLFRGTDSPTSVATVLALGSIDQSISVWVTGHPRPVLVFKDVFERQVTDLSWSADGLVLYASSADGSLAVFQFTHDQLPMFATDKELENARNVFGYRRPQPVNGHGALVHRSNSNALSTPIRQSASQVPALLNGTPARLQQEITIKNGKRRIRPTPVGGSDSHQFAGSYAPAGQPHASTSALSAAAGDRSLARTVLTNGIAGDNFSRGIKRKAEDAMPDGYEGRGVDARLPPLPPVARSVRRETGATLGGQLQRELIPPSHAGQMIHAGHLSVGSGVRLIPAPVAAFFRVEEAGCMLDIRNFDGSGSRPAEISQIELPIENGQERLLWMDFAPAAVVSATITPSFSAVVTADRTLIVYTSKGRRILNVTLDALPFIMKSVGKYLMVITTVGDLFRWNLDSLKQLGPPTSLVPILTASSTGSVSPQDLTSSLVDAHLFTNGAPILITAFEKAYTLDQRSSSSPSSSPPSSASPSGFLLVCISDAWWAEHSPFWDRTSRARLSMLGGTAGVEGGGLTLWQEPLRAIESEINSLVLSRRGGASRYPAPPSGSQASGLQSVVALRHLETRLLACELLESPAEYRANLMLYAQRLADEGIRNMAEELIRSLLGPVYYRPGAEESWEPEVLGFSKRTLLAHVLATMSTGRLQALAEQYQDVLRAVTTPGL